MTASHSFVSKRKHSSTTPSSVDTHLSKRSLSYKLLSKRRERGHDIVENFADGLITSTRKASLREQYISSAPYKHCIIDNLVDEELLRDVRKEIIEELHFTSKETDIYKIHQTGDLANLSGLGIKELERLTSLFQLRNALYSKVFRNFISDICGCGDLSGMKQDMSINCYVNGSHLLTHDDVIGSRRVSYILYLPDPDEGWEPQWGGALRLYRVKEKNSPEPCWEKVISPKWNQLAFFMVEPGNSFHVSHCVLRAKCTRYLVSDMLTLF